MKSISDRKLDYIIENINNYLVEEVTDYSKEINGLARDLRAVAVRINDIKRKIPESEISDDDLKLLRGIIKILKDIRKSTDSVLSIED